MIGAGRLGASFARALTEAGASLLGVSCRTEAGRLRAERDLDTSGWTEIAALVDHVHDRAGLYLVCVPDAALPEASDRLAEAVAPDRGRETAVAHTSGATSTAVLSRCAEAGMLTLSLHPLQTFSDPTPAPERLRGVSMAVTPGDPGTADDALRLGRSLAEAVGARPFLLREDDRVLYHAAATIASNYLVTLEHVAEGLISQAGLPAEEALPALLPLILGAVDNLARQGTIGALTGPLSRGDETTVAAHLESLAARAPETLPLYRALGTAALDIVRARSEVSAGTVERLRHLLAAQATTTSPSRRRHPYEFVKQPREGPQSTGRP